jgi:glycosyltransferase involved in cell wall biosynthesis
MGKKLLFVINNLECGGAENSLISLLHELDYSTYDVDLLLLTKKGFFLKNVPSSVTILPQVDEFGYFDQSFSKAIFKAILKFRFDIILSRLLYYCVNEQNAAVKEQKLWKYISLCIPKLKKQYDVAIGFLEKTPNYYVVDKVKAQKKMGFIRTDYQAMKMDASIDKPYFERLNYILTNSTNATTSLLKIFPEYHNKIVTIENFFSKDTLNALAEEKIAIEKAVLNIVSVGRIEQVKGYDLAIDACKIIKDTGISIKWFVIGEGALRANLQDKINKLNLSNDFVFIGLKENPHPYIKQADIYVQTSRFEGKSRAIEEAKIHQKPIVVTNYPSVNDQITNNENGIIVDFTPESIAFGILEIFHNNLIKNKLISNLQNNSNSNSQEQLKLLYNLISN